MGATGSPSRATRHGRRSRTPSATTARAPSTRCTSQPKARRRPRASSRPRRASAAQAAAGRGSTRRTGWASRGAASCTLCTRSTRTRSCSRARPTARAPRATPPRRTRPSRRSLRRRAPTRRPRREEEPTTRRTAGLASYAAARSGLSRTLVVPHTRQADALKLHGSATALPWRDDHYLALFHTVSVGAGARGAYTSFAYTFSAEPPFAITGVSRALPLARLLRSYHPASCYLVITPARGALPLVRAAARIPNAPTQP